MRSLNIRNISSCCVPKKSFHCCVYSSGTKTYHHKNQKCFEFKSTFLVILLFYHFIIWFAFFFLNLHNAKRYPLVSLRFRIPFGTGIAKTKHYAASWKSVNKHLFSWFIRMERAKTSDGYDLVIYYVKYHINDYNVGRKNA